MATKRRKGEKPVAHGMLLWTDGDCRIPQAIREGDRRLDCWIRQQCVPVATLAKRSGVAEARLWELLRDAEPTDAELEALAGTLRTDAASLRASVYLALDVRRKGMRS